jgi:hypothetical protein
VTNIVYDTVTLLLYQQLLCCLKGNVRVASAGIAASVRFATLTPAALEPQNWRQLLMRLCTSHASSARTVCEHCGFQAPLLLLLLLCQVPLHG